MRVPVPADLVHAGVMSEEPDPEDHPKRVRLPLGGGWKVGQVRAGKADETWPQEPTEGPPDAQG